MLQTIMELTNKKMPFVDLIHFAYANNTAMHSSTKVDDTIRYMSLHYNKYLRYFAGHTKKVISLCISSVEDTFLSGSLYKTMLLWDLHWPNCHGILFKPRNLDSFIIVDIIDYHSIELLKLSHIFIFFVDLIRLALIR